MNAKEHMFLLTGSLPYESRNDETFIGLFTTFELAYSYLETIGACFDGTFQVEDLNPPSTLIKIFWVDRERSEPNEHNIDCKYKEYYEIQK